MRYFVFFWHMSSGTKPSIFSHICDKKQWLTNGKVKILCHGQCKVFLICVMYLTKIISFWQSDVRIPCNETFRTIVGLYFLYCIEIQSRVSLTDYKNSFLMMNCAFQYRSKSSLIAILRYVTYLSCWIMVSFLLCEENLRGSSGCKSWNSLNGAPLDDWW